MVLVSEVQQFMGRLVVEIHKAIILSQRVHDYFVGLHEEVYFWQETVFLKKVVNVTVGKDHHLFRGRLARVENSLFDVLIFARALVSEQCGDAFNTFLLLGLAQNFVIFLDQVLEDRFK